MYSQAGSVVARITTKVGSGMVGLDKVSLVGMWCGMVGSGVGSTIEGINEIPSLKINSLRYRSL